MHFETRAQAQAFLDAQGFTPALKRRHRVVLDRYFSLESWEYLPCWTVILS